MAVFVPTLNITLDLSRPVEELNHVISHVANLHPGREVEILETVGKAIHEAVKKIEKEKNEQIKKEKSSEPRKT